MLNALTSYQFDDDRPVRVVLVQGEPWFVATDIAAVLGYRNGPDMTRNLADDERGTHIVRTPSADQTMTIISESGLYAAIFKSRREEAQRFRKWVTSEVLPAIRRHGRYELPPPPEAPPMVAQDIDTARLTAAIGVVREARQVWGPVQTRLIWARLGLPMPVVEATADHDADPLVAQIADWIEDKAEVTVNELATGLGLDPAALDMAARRRMTAALRLLGWRDRNVKIGHGTVRTWTRIPRTHGEG